MAKKAGIVGRRDGEANRRAAARRLAGKQERGPGLAGCELPHDELAERLVVGWLVADETGAAWQEALALGLTVECFHDQRNALIAAVVCALREEGSAVDVVAVCRRLHELRQLDRVGGAEAVVAAANEAGSWLGFRSAVQSLAAMAVRRAAIRASVGLYESLVAADDEQAAKWQDVLFELRATTGAQELPPLLGWSAFVETDRPKPRELISGLLHQGAKLMLGGGSKSFKTWVLLDLGLSVATGTPWWGLATTEAPVLYINLELAIEFCQERVQEIRQAKHIEAAPNFYSWHLRGYARDLAELVPLMVARCSGIGFGLIILDPIYKVLGEREENSNGEVAQLLNEVESFAVKTGAAVAFGHHFSKGNQSGKEARDRVSGAGAWARDPDALITLTPHKQDDHFVVEFVLRNCRPKSPFVVRWDYPLMVPADGLDPTDLREPGRPKEHTADKLLSVLGDHMLTFTEWQQAAAEAGISKSSFKRLRNELLQAGRVTHSGNCYKRKQ